MSIRANKKINRSKKIAILLGFIAILFFTIGYLGCTNDEVITDHFNEYSFACESCNNPQHFIFESNKILPADKWHLKVWYFPDVNDNLVELINSRFEAFEEFTGLTFTKVDDIEDSDIRISADSGRGAYSYIGNSIFRIPNTVATMNIGFTDIRTIPHPYIHNELVKTFRVIDHEICHTLGLTHEQFNKNGGIEWVEDKVYEYYRRSGWSDAAIETNIIGNRNGVFIENEGDPESIMLYWIPCELTVGDDFCERINRLLSPVDSSWIYKYYPREDDNEEDWRCWTITEWNLIFQNN